MPTYDYQCAACGHKFEKFQSIKADPVKECPACHAESARRLIGTGAGIIFKGGGFYETDYRSDSYSKDAKKDSGDAGDKKADKSDKGDKSDKPAKTEAKADSKPESKPEPKPAPKPEPAKA